MTTPVALGRPATEDGAAGCRALESLTASARVLPPDRTCRHNRSPGYRW
jgi:hypothetical protein